MTNEIILSQVARNLGYETFRDNGCLITDYTYALYWAMMELTSGNKSLYADITIPLKGGTNMYVLPDGFDNPRQVTIIDSNNEKVENEELDYDQIVDYAAGQNLASDARYSDKYLVAFRRSNEASEIYIYPSLTGKLYITYEAIIQEDMDISSNKTPPINRKFHHKLVDGATAYLLQRKVRITEDARDLILLRGYQKSFDKAKEDYAKFALQRGDPPVQKGFEWYDKPESYI